MSHSKLEYIKRLPESNVLERGSAVSGVLTVSREEAVLGGDDSHNSSETSVDSGQLATSSNEAVLGADEERSSLELTSDLGDPVACLNYSITFFNSQIKPNCNKVTACLSFSASAGSLVMAYFNWQSLGYYFIAAAAAFALIGACRLYEHKNQLNMDEDFVENHFRNDEQAQVEVSRQSSLQSRDQQHENAPRWSSFASGLSV